VAHVQQVAGWKLPRANCSLPATAVYMRDCWSASLSPCGSKHR
jgi:hypothetical protein